jgi:hypothetical protein
MATTTVPTNLGPASKRWRSIPFHTARVRPPNMLDRRPCTRYTTNSHKVYHSYRHCYLPLPRCILTVLQPSTKFKATPRAPRQLWTNLICFLIADPWTFHNLMVSNPLFRYYLLRLKKIPASLRLPKTPSCLICHTSSITRIGILYGSQTRMSTAIHGWNNTLPAWTTTLRCNNRSPQPKATVMDDVAPYTIQAYLPTMIGITYQKAVPLGALLSDGSDQFQSTPYITNDTRDLIIAKMGV